MAAIYSNGGNRWNILGFNFTKRDALSSVYKISMVFIHVKTNHVQHQALSATAGQFCAIDQSNERVKCPTVRECFRVKFPPMQD